MTPLSLRTVILYGVSLVLFIFHLQCGRTFASPIEAKEPPPANLLTIMRATSVADVRRTSEDHRAKDRSYRVCLAQLKSQRVPTECLKITQAGSQYARKERKWLERLCVQWSEKSTDWRELKEVSEGREIPMLCRKAAKERWIDLKYQLESENPAAVFSHFYEAFQ